MKTLSDQAVGTAHGKLILIGEHAVVYSEPAIAFPFPAAPVEVRIKKITGQTVLTSTYFQGLLHAVPEPLNNLKTLIHTICHDLNQSVNGLNISILSQIPPERGMGSSAAVATAVTRALFSLFERELTQERLLTYVDISEKIAHGNPSGLDARVTSSDSPIYYKRGSCFKPLELNLKGYLIAADTGVKGQTREAVGDVARQMQENPSSTEKTIRTLGQLSDAAKAATETNQIEELGRLLSLAHSCLKQLNVSSNQLDRLVETALASNALGAKLTGGGRGGCMIALAKTKKQAEDIARHLKENGATQTWIHALGEKSND
ncbi:mevalonate kinase [Alkalibacterium sp.]|nr:MAG: mevalonate kinase [Alkalibacterium sp.]